MMKEDCEQEGQERSMMKEDCDQEGQEHFGWMMVVQGGYGLEGQEHFGWMMVVI